MIDVIVSLFIYYTSSVLIRRIFELDLLYQIIEFWITMLVLSIFIWNMGSFFFQNIWKNNFIWSISSCIIWCGRHKKNEKLNIKMSRYKTEMRTYITYMSTILYLHRIWRYIYWRYVYARGEWLVNYATF